MNEGTKKRGFAAMDPEKHRAVASAGGKRAHALGKGHRFTSEQARLAGSKGGKARRRSKEEIEAARGAEGASS